MSCEKSSFRMPYPDPIMLLLVTLGLGGLMVPGILKLRACSNAGAQITSNSPNVEDLDQMVGRRLDLLIKRFGLPDSILTKEVFQAKFVGMDQAEVVLTYDRFGRNVWVTRKSEIIAVIETKESLMSQ